MIRRHLMMLRLGLMVVDASTAAIVFLIASRARYGGADWLSIWDRLGLDLRVTAVLFGVGWVAVLWLVGLYRLRTRWTLLTELKDIVKATLIVAALTLFTLFLFKHQDVSRLFLMALFTLLPLVTFVGRAALRTGFGFLRRRGYNLRYMLVVGDARLAQDFADRVERNTRLGIEVIGHLSTSRETRFALTRPVLGTLDDLPGVLHDRTVDEVAVCLPPDAAGFAEQVIRLAVDEGKTVRMPIDPLVMSPALAVAEVGAEEEFDGMIVRSVVHGTQRELGLVAKRLIDIVGAVAGMVILSPLILGTALAIGVTSGSPVIFRQTRVGLHGRLFTLYKFRTMIPDAEEHLDDVLHLNEREGPSFKAADDPRTTRLGRTLRRTSIDELPQLWNVLAGDMSLVGPRPQQSSEVGGYAGWHRRRLSMKPGITGLWQVEARDDPAFDRCVERDLSYIDSWSVGLDLRILVRTIPAVVTRTGR